LDISDTDSTTKTIEMILKQNCSERCREWTTKQVCTHHRYKRHPSTLALATYYSTSPYFINWLKVKHTEHKNISSCFVYKQHKERGDSTLKNTSHLFNRFLRYAADIDNGLEYVDYAMDISDFTFLDLGFAPGGMVSLLLEVGKGVGVNLEPSEGGNVYPTQLELVVKDGIVQFEAVNMDIIQLARQNCEFYSRVEIRTFDMVIVGITTSGSKQERQLDELELKNLLHFAQLLVAFRYLKKGGAILIRMHLSLRLVDLHLITFLFENFKGLVKVTKPLTEFAMRKTYWLFVDGFDPVDGAIDRLEALVKETEKAPYDDVDADILDGTLHNPILMTESVDELLSKYGDVLIQTLNPMWQAQCEILEFIKAGKSDRMCGYCKSGNGPCSKCIKVVPECILDAAGRVRERLQGHINKYV
jgi:hypothetical protein